MIKWIWTFYFVSFYCFGAAIGYIPSQNKLAEIHHQFYSLGYVEQYEQSAWTYYHYKKEYLRGEQQRRNNFRQDPSVLTDSAKPEEYYYSGFDRGHLVPAGDMKHSIVSMEQSFFMSNISPQKPYFNRGLWRKLENQVRRWVESKGSLHIFTGPIFGAKPAYIPNTKIAIPKAFYKIILKKTNKEHHAVAFVMKNERSKEAIQKFLVTIDTIEQLTGIDFLSSLPDHIENKLESEIKTQYWF